MNNPQRVEQCLPKEGASPERVTGAMSIKFPHPSINFPESRIQRFGAPARRVEQCLPKEGATLGRVTGAMNIKFLHRSINFPESRMQRFGAPARRVEQYLPKEGATLERVARNRISEDRSQCSLKHERR
ncbi:MAG: hypothetical protein K0S36_1732 [Nitrosospira multiformis]|jgi:hypothetical protein|nr:hypothetical protein [Nitrosospira multiformis]